MNQEAWAALKIAIRAHADQKRADGKPFIDHPVAVAAAVDKFFARDDLLAAAFLHDVLEDTIWTANDLRESGISAETVRLVQYLTRVDGESYEDYIRRVASSRDASIIKRCDLHHNLVTVDDYRPTLRKRYEAALEVLPTR